MRNRFVVCPCIISFSDFDVYVVMIDFSSKSGEMCQFFEKRAILPVSVVKAGHHRAQQFDRQSALQTSQKDKNDRIPVTFTFHPHNHAVKSTIVNNIKLLQYDPDNLFATTTNFIQTRQKRDNFLVRSALKTNEQPRTSKMHALTMQDLSFHSKHSGPKRSVKITDSFTCTSANVIYCITCTLCNKIYIGETGRPCYKCLMWEGRQGHIRSGDTSTD